MERERSREEIEALLISRGWTGSADDPVFQRIVSSIQRMSGTRVAEQPCETDDEAPPPAPGTPQGAIYCSFCGSLQADVHKLIAGPSVYICDVCADKASKLL